LFSELQRPTPNFDIEFTLENDISDSETHIRKNPKFPRNVEDDLDSAVQRKKSKVGPSNDNASHGFSSVLALHKAKLGNQRPVPTSEQLSRHYQTFGKNISNTITSSSRQEVIPNQSPSHSASSTPILIGAHSSAETGPSPSASQNLNTKFKSPGIQRTRRLPANCSPARLGYYSPRSKSILREAKLKYRIYIATQVAFPTTAQSIEHAAIKYNTTCDEYAVDVDVNRAALPPIDAGRLQVVSRSFQVCIYAQYLTFYYKTYNVGATMRGELKMHGRTIVLREYKIMPHNAEEISDKEKRKSIRENVLPLLDKGAWAHAPAAKVLNPIANQCMSANCFQSRVRRNRYLPIQLSSHFSWNIFLLGAILMLFITLMHLALLFHFLP
jgi:hypothetical protein